MTLKIVSRDLWRAVLPTQQSTMPLPQPEVWLHHTAGNEPDGPAGVRAVQRYHMLSRGYYDIAYSFVVDRQGLVYVGRGPGVAGAHTRGHNTTSHAICVLGNYDRDPVPDGVVEAVAGLLRHGKREGWWPAAELTGGHRDVGNTSCPGSYLYAAIGHINRLAKTPGRQEDIMRQGDNGPRVAAWQHRLSWLGVDCTVDGDFGPKTVEATKKAQGLLGLASDGEVHATEWALLVATRGGNELKEHVKDVQHGGSEPHHHDKRYSRRGHGHEATVTIQ